MQWDARNQDPRKHSILSILTGTLTGQIMSVHALVSLSLHHYIFSYYISFWILEHKILSFSCKNTRDGNMVMEERAWYCFWELLSPFLQRLYVFYRKPIALYRPQSSILISQKLVVEYFYSTLFEHWNASPALLLFLNSIWNSTACNLDQWLNALSAVISQPSMWSGLASDEPEAKKDRDKIGGVQFFLHDHCYILSSASRWINMTWNYSTWNLAISRMKQLICHVASREEGAITWNVWLVRNLKWQAKGYGLDKFKVFFSHQ